MKMINYFLHLQFLHLQFSQVQLSQSLFLQDLQPHWHSSFFSSKKDENFLKLLSIGIS